MRFFDLRYRLAQRSIKPGGVKAGKRGKVCRQLLGDKFRRGLDGFGGCRWDLESKSQVGCEVGDDSGGFSVLGDSQLDAPDGVKNGRMIASTEAPADLGR